MAIETKPSVPAKATEQPLRRRDPFELMNELREDMARLWREGWPAAVWGRNWPSRRPATTAAPWAPTMDVYENEGALMVKAELPGVKKNDVDVSLDRGDLVIRGERKEEHEVKDEDYHRMERSYGSFYRRLPLGFEVKPEQIKANFSDGVLQVRIPMPAEERPQPQRINVA